MLFLAAVFPYNISNCHWAQVIVIIGGNPTDIFLIYCDSMRIRDCEIDALHLTKTLLNNLHARRCHENNVNCSELNFIEFAPPVAYQGVREGESRKAGVECCNFIILYAKELCDYVEAYPQNFNDVRLIQSVFIKEFILPNVNNDKALELRETMKTKIRDL